MFTSPMLKLTPRNRVALLLLALTPPLGLIITPPARAQENPAALPTVSGRQMRQLPTDQRSGLLEGMGGGGPVRYQIRMNGPEGGATREAIIIAPTPQP